MKVYFLMCDGFEETEAITPWDLLIRAGADVSLVSVYGNEYVKGAHDLVIKTDNDILSVSDDYDMIVLPGGGLGTENLASSESVSRLLLKAFSENKYIAAICAAPSVLGGLGLLENKKAICFPGFENRLKGAILTPAKVVKDGNIITSVGMGASFEFGLELVKVLYGEEKSQLIAKSTHNR